MDAPAGRHHAEHQQGGLATASERTVAPLLFRLGAGEENAVQGHDLHHTRGQHPLWTARGAPDDARRRSALDLSAAPSGGRCLPGRRSALGLRLLAPPEVASPTVTAVYFPDVLSGEKSEAVFKTW